MPSPAPPQIFSARRLAARANRARGLQGSSGAAGWLGDAMIDDVLERIDFIRLPPTRALVLGERGAALAQALATRGMEVTTAPAGELDLERPYPASDFGLIVSMAMLDTVNDLPGALIHQRQALAPQGVMLAAMVGAGSLPRLRAALLAADGDRPAARLHPAVDPRSGAGLLQRAGFARQVADAWTLKVAYRSLDALVADLRAQGLTSALADAPPPLTRTGLERARAAFLQGGDPDGRVIETLEILTLTGWR
jgi:SAM-dependent methyltransferase